MSSPLHQYAIAVVGVAVTSTPRTLLQLRGAASRRGRLVAIAGAFHDTDPTHGPARIEVCRQSTDGTATGVTPVPTDPAMPAALLSGAHTATIEPTESAVIYPWSIPVVGGAFHLDVRHMELCTGASVDSNIGIQVSAPNNTTADLVLFYEE